ncbi:hemoglobin [Singulisphaera sp. GP187]|uniref:group III truncated hemoglobin n=1 Tax=Singulisphaera sp. GP187 TaxID=1882752 RepID=UPI000928FB35|nr:group III truncated hemoglobin [Singulisphaera sp. GP187]SIO58553.1 hemoglobin [Singulisphaera sp. GP187]
MERPASVHGMGEPAPHRSYRLPLTEPVGLPHPDAEGITEGLIHDVVMEFYQRARRDGQLGPVFEAHIHEWESHLGRMIDFWSTALLRTGRYSGRPVERHRLIDALSEAHFGRWIELFEATVRDLCPLQEADAFLVRAQRMRDGLTKSLRLVDGAAAGPGNQR